MRGWQRDTRRALRRETAAGRRVRRPPSLGSDAEQLVSPGDSEPPATPERDPKTAEEEEEEPDAPVPPPRQTSLVSHGHKSSSLHRHASHSMDLLSCPEPRVPKRAGEEGRAAADDEEDGYGDFERYPIAHSLPKQIKLGLPAARPRRRQESPVGRGPGLPPRATQEAPETQPAGPATAAGAPPTRAPPPGTCRRRPPSRRRGRGASPGPASPSSAGRRPAAAACPRRRAEPRPRRRRRPWGASRGRSRSRRPTCRPASPSSTRGGASPSGS